MKSREPYEIHALIGRCHLHYKKRASFSVTLKIGKFYFMPQVTKLLQAPSLSIQLVMR